MSKAHLPGDSHLSEPGMLPLDDLAERPWAEPFKDGLPSATTRAGYALSAVLDHNLTTAGGNRKEEGEPSVRGLVADLFHLCDALQIDWDTVVGAARQMYQDEI